MGCSSSAKVVDAGFFTDKGPFRRRNEDVAVADTDAGVYIVADGLGGAAAGDRAARVATDLMCFALINDISPRIAIAQALPETELRTALQEYVGSGFDVSAPFDRMRFGYLLAHFGVLAEASRSGSVGMATAMVAVWHHDGLFTIGHVGDCRAYAFTGGALEQLTRDHSLSAMLAGRMSLPKGAENSDFLRSRLTQVVGGEICPAPDLSCWTPRPPAGLLLVSDGVWGALDDEAMAELVRAGGTAKRVSRTLVESAIEAGSRDNATALWVSL